MGRSDDQPADTVWFGTVELLGFFDKPGHLRTDRHVGRTLRVRSGETGGREGFHGLIDDGPTGAHEFDKLIRRASALLLLEQKKQLKRPNRPET